jgi:hypothetical protein
MIARERRARKWKSTRQWQNAQREKRKLEKRLGRLKEALKPDDDFNVEGIMVGVHVIRGRFQGGREFRFEFGRKEARDRHLAHDFGERDLDVLIEAVRRAKVYRSRFVSQNGSLRI